MFNKSNDELLKKTLLYEHLSPEGLKHFPVFFLLHKKIEK